MTTRRGRPPKEKFLYPMAVCAPATQADSVALGQKLSALACVQKLTEPQRDQLLHRLLSDLDNYKLATVLNAKRKTSRGNKKKAHVSLLIYSCAVSWCDVLGVSETRLWEAPQNSNTAKESPAVELARSCLEVATGKSYSASLRQQFSGAAKWSRPNGI